MLTISPELAEAFETQTLLRWKVEITATLRRDYPVASAGFQGQALENWVRDTMETVRRKGATTRADIAFFAVTLFRVAEVEKDTRAAGDFVAIMVSDNTFSAQMSLLRKAFAGVPG
jgi:hypothetical protein